MDVGKIVFYPKNVSISLSSEKFYHLFLGIPNDANFQNLGMFLWFFVVESL